MSTANVAQAEAALRTAKQAEAAEQRKRDQHKLIETRRRRKQLERDLAQLQSRQAAALVRDEDLRNKINLSIESEAFWMEHKRQAGLDVLPEDHPDLAEWRQGLEIVQRQTRQFRDEKAGLFMDCSKNREKELADELTRTIFVESNLVRALRGELKGEIAGGLRSVR